VREKAQNIPCVFLDHPVTKEKIRSLGLDNLLDSPGITRMNKLRYYQFINLAAKSQFIITDSGGLQEESAYLGIPCLVHRLTTERGEGLGSNVVLSHYDETAAKEFLENPRRYRTEGIAGVFSPTQVILKELQAKNYISSSLS
jgi:UDP-N-acetylglucosamine 2-epimerase (non-hydrolysing)